MPTFSYLKTGFFGIIALILVLSIISFPQQAFDSSLRGLTIWWDVVFPALLPFMITAELLMGFGVVHFLGVLFEPFMRPLFRVPGAGGFVMAMGLSSGNPIGAKLTVRLREQNLITRSEGERLVSIAGTSGPLFMFGAVAVGFFHDVKIGIIIAASHYIAALLVGLTMRFHDYHGEATPSHPPSHRNSFYRALAAMHRARLHDGRPLGTLMGDAVTSSIQTLLMIGGFIIMFSVIINIITLIGISQLISFFFSLLCALFGLNPLLSLPLFSGLFEMTLGSKLASEATLSIPLVHKVAVASAIIAWSGLSVHAQVASLLAKTDIRYKPYLLARLLHAFLAGLWAILLWEPLQRFIGHLAVFQQDGPLGTIGADWNRYTLMSGSLLLVGILLLVISSLIYWAKAKMGREKLY